MPACRVQRQPTTRSSDRPRSCGSANHSAARTCQILCPSTQQGLRQGFRQGEHQDNCTGTRDKSARPQSCHHCGMGAVELLAQICNHSVSSTSRAPWKEAMVSGARGNHGKCGMQDAAPASRQGSQKTDEQVPCKPQVQHASARAAALHEGTLTDLHIQVPSTRH